MHPDLSPYLGRTTGALVFVLLAACSGSSTPTPVLPADAGSEDDATSADATANDTGPDVPAAPVAAPYGALKQKSGDVVATDLAAALSLPRDALCEELGAYDCVRDVHRITLGGVEPYSLGIRTPLASPSVTAPLALDRLAFAACGERVRLDFDGAETDGLFAALAKTSDDAAYLQVATELVSRLLARDPNPAELEALLGFRDDVSGTGKDAARQWSLGACAAVATSVEFLFY